MMERLKPYFEEVLAPKTDEDKESLVLPLPFGNRFVETELFQFLIISIDGMFSLERLDGSPEVAVVGS